MAIRKELIDEAIANERRRSHRPGREALYPIVYLDALMVKMRQDGKVDNRAVYTAIGINMEGQKSILGLWVSGNEGAKYWMSVLQNLKNRGMKDAFHLYRWAEGISGGDRGSVSEHTGWKERKAMAADLKRILSRNGGARTGRVSSEVSEAPAGGRCVGTELAASDPVLRIPGGDWQDYLHDQCGGIASYGAAKSDEESRLLPTQEAAIKLLYLALQKVSRKWQTVQGCREAPRQFAIRWPERMQLAAAA